MSEHPLHTRQFQPLAELSPFVPAGHEDIYVHGFARFFGGDFISALHVLVPQLENSLRYVLKQVAIDPSSIQNDMTQESRSISVMLDKDRAALEEIFVTAIVYESENLFDFRGGPAVRHQLAHGLLSSDACNGPEAIYACWFIFRLCCLPLFRIGSRLLPSMPTFDVGEKKFHRRQPIPERLADPSRRAPPSPSTCTSF